MNMKYMYMYIFAGRWKRLSIFQPARARRCTSYMTLHELVRSFVDSSGATCVKSAVMRQLHVTFRDSQLQDVHYHQ